jgi:hypothetical protein
MLKCFWNYEMDGQSGWADGWALNNENCISGHLVLVGLLQLVLLCEAGVILAVWQ